MQNERFTIWPCRGKILEREDILTVDDCLTDNVQVVLFRADKLAMHVGFISGDGAVAIRRQNIRWLRIIDVSKLSGCATAAELPVTPLDPSLEAEIDSALSDKPPELCCGTPDLQSGSGSIPAIPFESVTKRLGTRGATEA